MLNCKDNCTIAKKMPKRFAFVWKNEKNVVFLHSQNKNH